MHDSKGQRSSFRHLLSPGRIGSMELRNRIIMAPMGSNLAEEDGRLGERIKRYYEARAAGGAGLLIMGVAAVAYPRGACNPNQVAISDDSFLPDLQDLAERVHAHGAKLAVQLQHAGKVATQDIAAGRPLWVPSELPMKNGDLLNDLSDEEIAGLTSYFMNPTAALAYHAMTADDIEALETMFADAADRARRAGFDAVEIHGAHGYILSSFLSPATNKRRDDYGGSLENRARLLLEVVRAVRARLGDDFPICCRLDAKEFATENGISVEDARRTAELVEEAGVDAVHVSAYADPLSGAAFTQAPLVHEPGGYVELAAGIKRRINVPVIAVGRIEPEQADRLISEGRADFVAMARKLLADPELPNKLSSGRTADLRPCIYCYTCVSRIFLNDHTRCAVNPATGREAEFEIVETGRSKKVIVIGGGPAGMEAARILALRGHDVALYERRRRLGGTLFFSSLLCEENARLVEYLGGQLEAGGVKVHLDCAVSAEMVKALDPDVVVVAVGAGHAKPGIKGADASHVLSGDELRALIDGSDKKVAADKLPLRHRAMLGLGSMLGVSDRISLARELTRHWMPIGKRVAVIGGGLVGIEMADFLSERGRDVTVLEEGRVLAPQMALPRRWRVLAALRERGVALMTSTKVEEIHKDSLCYLGDGGEQGRVAADSVIFAAGIEANPRLAREIEALGLEVRSIGDCEGPGYIEGAILDAQRLAIAL